MIDLADLLQPVPPMKAVRMAVEAAFSEVFGVRLEHPPHLPENLDP
jgi:hypothetical protein